MKLKSKHVGMLVALLALSACGSNDESYTYQYEVNGCNTGKHEFGNKSDYCKGLKDDALNNSCAAGTRQETYQRECS